MFKLQLILGLCLGIQFTTAVAELQVESDIVDLREYGSSLYGPRDYTMGEVLKDVYNSNDPDFNPDDINPEELGSYLEGDLLIPTDNDDDYEVLTKNGRLKTATIWPGGLVPYALDGDFTNSEIRSLLYAFDQYDQHTCIHFIPRTIEKDYIVIQKLSSGCHSAVGRMGGKQFLNLSPGSCWRYGTIMHELLHSLGFSHEHKRYDRDDYLKIHFEHMKTPNDSNYRKASPDNYINYGIPYDYESILHYSSRVNSKNGEITLEPLKKLPDGVKLGQRKGFSASDLDRIRARYRC